MIRQPIITVMGHVDHGKTSLLDKIRNTAIASREAGGITQHIGASEVPLDVIEKICGPVLKKMGADIKLPGLLFIDTPGHEAFTNLRKRGGSISDLAILVVDITKNFEPQTYEALNILKEYKTPFLVAANKIDLITGWRAQPTYSFAESLEKQQPNVVADLEAKLYTLVGSLSEAGFASERFDRVTDVKKEVSIMPLSAKTGEGIAELLMYAAGLSQRFLEKRLEIDPTEPGIGGILELKEEKGLGITLDAILYNGNLKSNDTIAFATATGIKTAKIRALLRPKPLQEMRESTSKFYYVDMVSAAAGVKISGSGFEDALAGSLIVSTSNPNYEKEISAELSEVFTTDKTGIILKADTIGSIEAISRLLKSSNTMISKKGLGKITKRDILDAFSMRATDPHNAIVLAFSVPMEDDAKAEAEAAGVDVISANIIYKLIDDYKLWLDNEKKREKDRLEKSLTFPGQIKVLPNSCFRVSHPAVFGVEVSAGRIRPSYLLIKENGDIIGRVKEIQDNAITKQEAKKGESVAISINDVTFGRQVKDNDVLYTFISSEEIRALKFKYSDMINDEDVELLTKLSEINSSSGKT
ncbi:MAG: translation initiation factor IF-2 [Candidatus Micrarchaeota archaeon]|nr:translation initiation factor IF-2 [Candidatus Micrarchaeota archaeon]MDE1860007.1 translation initiation factor IF-2 [Candidatus Micrarchaeota archaeon]